MHLSVQATTDSTKRAELQAKEKALQAEYSSVQKKISDIAAQEVEARISVQKKFQEEMRSQVPNWDQTPEGKALQDYLKDVESRKEL